MKLRLRTAHPFDAHGQLRHQEGSGPFQEGWFACSQRKSLGQSRSTNQLTPLIRTLKSMLVLIAIGVIIRSDAKQPQQKGRNEIRSFRVLVFIG